MQPGEPMRASGTEPAFLSVSEDHVVQHTSRSFCGQIGSHKARGRYRSMRRAWSHAAVPGVVHLSRPIAASYRHACFRMHPIARMGIVGLARPSIREPHLRARRPTAACCKGVGSLTKHLSSKPSSNDLLDCDPPRCHAGSKCNSLAPPPGKSPPFLFTTWARIWNAGLAIPKTHQRLHQDHDSARIEFHTLH